MASLDFTFNPEQYNAISIIKTWINSLNMFHKTEAQNISLKDFLNLAKPKITLKLTPPTSPQLSIPYSPHSPHSPSITTLPVSRPGKAKKIKADSNPLIPSSPTLPPFPPFVSSTLSTLPTLPIPPFALSPMPLSLPTTNTSSLLPSLLSGPSGLSSIPISPTIGPLKIKIHKKESVKIAIIGSSGKKEIVNDISYGLNDMGSETLFHKMIEEAHQKIREINDGEKIMLYSGGAAWSDHVAVKLFLFNPEIYELTLMLPTEFDLNLNQFKDNGSSDWRANPGKIANDYHHKFSLVLSKPLNHSLNEIREAIDKGAQLLIKKGFHARNTTIATAKYLIAFTWENEYPKNGGTADTWKKANESIRSIIDLKVLLADEKIHHRLDLADINCDVERDESSYLEFTQLANEIVKSYFGETVIDTDIYEQTIFYIRNLLIYCNGQLNDLLSAIDREGIANYYNNYIENADKYFSDINNFIETIEIIKARIK